MWVMDRGIPTKRYCRRCGNPAREIFYLVGTPKGKIQQYERVAGSALAEGPRVVDGENCLSRTVNLCVGRVKKKSQRKPPWRRKQSGPFAQKAPCHAPQLAFSGPAVDALGRRGKQQRAAHFQFVQMQVPEKPAVTAARPSISCR